MGLKPLPIIQIEEDIKNEFKSKAALNGKSMTRVLKDFINEYITDKS